MMVGWARVTISTSSGPITFNSFPSSTQSDFAPRPTALAATENLYRKED
jgi:hypothetical protein